MWNGTQQRIVEVYFQRGIEGNSNISDIPEGYCIDAVNMDLSKKGRAIKRPGYNVWGCPLPVRTRNLEVGATRKVTLDAVPLLTLELELYLNTGNNATDVQKAEVFQIDDQFNTVFAKVNTGFREHPFTVTRETLFEFVDVSGNKQLVAPLEVFDNNTFILPIYILSWLSAPLVPALSDSVPYTATVRICSGFSFNALRETDIDVVEVSSVTGNSVILTISDKEKRDKLPIGSQVLFETVLQKPDTATDGTLPLDGYVSGVNGEIVTITVSDSTLLTIGNYDLNYFVVRYLSGKSYWYRSEEKSFVNNGPLYSGTSNFVRMLGANSMEFDSVYDLLPVPGASSYNEAGFLYGTGIDVGFVNFTSKYFDTDTQKDRIVCAYDGNVFREEDFLFPLLPTISSLRYTGTDDVVYVNPADNTFEIPLSDAHKVYKVNDIVTVAYAVNTANETIEASFVVEKVETDKLFILTNGDDKFVLLNGMRFQLTRQSNTIHVAATTDTFPLFAGMTVQIGSRNNRGRWYVVKEVFVDATSGDIGDKYVVLDDEVTWMSDDTLYMMPFFQPIFQPESYFPLNPAYVNRGMQQMSAAPVDRSVYIATGLNGIWRFNGEQTINMKIPRPPAGLQRNIPGGGGFLRTDESANGVKDNGRIYDFQVTYSYAELVNGVFKEYESGLNPVGSYRVISEQADNGRIGSKLVELQIPTIPNGIGLPAENMTINVYRKLDGDAAGDIVDQPYLLELQKNNDPNSPFVSLIVGFDAPLSFNSENRKVLYTSLGAPESSEIARPVDDPPLVSALTTHENRLFAMNGYQQPYVKSVCSSVFRESDNSFLAHASLSLVPVFSSDNTYRFITCPSAMNTVSASNGAGSLGYKFQIFQAPYWEVKEVSLTDNSHLFKVNTYTVTGGTRYLLRFANGEKESLQANSDDVYYEGFDFEAQVFTGTAIANQLEAVKKWKAVDGAGAVVTPSEEVIPFEEVQELTGIGPENGLQIGSNNEEGSLAVPTFNLFITEAAPSLSAGDYIILHGLGSLGNVQNASGRILSFDRDLVFKVETAINASGVTTYELIPFRRKRTTGGTGTWEKITVTAGYPVSNAGEGVIHGNCVIYKADSSSYTMSDFSLSPTEFGLEVSAGGVGSPPALPTTAGAAFQIDGLPFALPEPTGINYNGRHELLGYAAGVYTFRLPGLPEEARGDLSVDMSAFSTQGRVTAATSQIVAGADYLEIYLQTQALTVDVRAGQYVYVICRGKNPDNYSLQLTGWFEISELYDGAAWSTTLTSGSTLERVRVKFTGEIDYDLLTGLSETRVIFTDTSSDTEKIIPVPVPTKRGTNNDGTASDITGTAYGPVDGYTPLEKVIRRFTHAINSTLHATGYAYWGGSAYGRIDGEIPVNGFIFYPHLYPENRYAHVFDNVDISSLITEPQWELRGADGVWSIEGDDEATATGLGDPITVRTAKEYYPARFWYTDPTSAKTRYLTRAFRVLSNDTVASEDGEELVTGVSFQSYLLMLKRNSIWRVRFAGGAVPIQERTQSRVGAASKKNAVATDRGVFFLHDSGVYVTDGSESREITATARQFEELAVQNRDLFYLSAGHHNPLNRHMYLGVPFSSSQSKTTDKVTGQFDFSYGTEGITLNSIKEGWSRNTNIPATEWVRILDGDYFGSTKGKVYRLRPETGPSRYRDEDEAIHGVLQTRFEPGGNDIQPKFFKMAFFQFGTETRQNMEVRVSWSYSRDTQELKTIPINPNEFGEAPFGTSYYGAASWAVPVRVTMKPIRVPQVSFTIENNEIDAAGETFGIFLEVGQASTRLVNQTSKLP